MDFLIFQHIACEHPGVFRKFFAANNITTTIVELDEGDRIPDLSGHDALWVMGGPMDVWQTDAHPWLVREVAAIREAVVERQMPYMGLCLGHQLLALALGGEAGPSVEPEIGIMDVALSETGTNSPIMAGLSDPQLCLQWHSAEVTKAPEGVEILASSPACKIQAMSYKDRAFSMQYHVELEDDTIPAWADIPEYSEALEKAAGPGALEEMRQRADANMPAFNAAAEQLFRNFLQITGLAEKIEATAARRSA
jgi:GMP synthase-like glutamine amidotransferase